MTTPDPHRSSEVNRDAATAAVVGSSKQGDTKDSLLGRVISGRYRLTEKLGEGGMGMVYRAEHLMLRKAVAVKFLHRELSAQKELVARFEREAVTTANLEHPNVVAAIDFGRLEDGTFFLVMEFAEGKSLRKALDEVGIFSPERALKVLRQVAAALAKAHSMHITHRDLKPENIVLCDRDGEPDFVKVIDFGIARVEPGTAMSNTPLTQAGMVFGTPEYMSPEQALGNTVDARSDQYALGIIAFELLTGKLPFDAEDMVVVLQAQITNPPPKASQQNPSLAPAIDPVLERILAKKPEARFPSVVEAINALEQAFINAPAPEGKTVFQPQAAISTSLPSPTPSTPQPNNGPGSTSVLSSTGTHSAAWAPAVPEAVAKPSVDPWKKVLEQPPMVLIVAAVVLTALQWTLLRPSGSSGGTTVGPNTTTTTTSAPRGSALERLEALRAEPEIRQAVASAWAGRPATFVTTMEARRDRHPDDAAVLYLLAEAYRLTGQNLRAVTNYRQALQREPSLGTQQEVVFNLVTALDDEQAWALAEETLQVGALASDPRVAQTAAERALESSNRRRAAQVAWRRRSALTPSLAARLQLRMAEDCTELTDAIRAARSAGGLAQRDAEDMEQGLCASFSNAAVCRQCQSPRRRR